MEQFQDIEKEHVINAYNIIAEKFSETRGKPWDWIESFYKNIEEPIIIDKHRGWPRNVVPAKEFLSKNPKIICTNRRVCEVITSYITLIERTNHKDNFIDKELRKRNKNIDNYNRSMLLWEKYFSDPYRSMVEGVDKFRNHIHIVEYDDLTSNPKETMKKIYKFLEIDEYSHEFNNIKNACAEDKDIEWGIKGLHDIRSTLKKVSKDPEEVIGKKLVKFFERYDLKY